MVAYSVTSSVSETIQSDLEPSFLCIPQEGQQVWVESANNGELGQVKWYGDARSHTRSDHAMLEATQAARHVVNGLRGGKTPKVELQV